MSRLLGERGVNVVLVARRPEALDDAAASVATETRNVVVDRGLPRRDAVQLMTAGAAALHD